ncbi:MAG: prepilin-type N-terminal cleavage/methylation domain-containing protein [Planctomycetaceae bacterium]|nr:prepilin-type N-terminal cleavage/methylation domain-containing protein [Planctomycetaceae bacterium]
MRKHRSFTLIEIMIVLVIAVILVSMAVPMVTGTLETQRLQSAANIIRSEWTEARLRAMNEGQIICFRCEIGGNKVILDRILDAHFTATLSTRETSRRFEVENELDPFEKGNFSGGMEDFILSDPSLSAEKHGTRLVELPKNVFAADVITLPDERAAFYQGLTTAGEKEIEDNISESEAVSRREPRLGETASATGGVWSTPIFFYPDGTTSAAAMLLKNASGRCIEIRLRAVTGVTRICGITSAENYIGELNSLQEQTGEN